MDGQGRSVRTGNTDRTDRRYNKNLSIIRNCVSYNLPHFSRGILLLLVFTSIFPAAQALFGYDEFTDDGNQTITETVENNIGQPCTDCNVSFWISFPNGTIHRFYLMRYNTSSSKYVRPIIPLLQLLNGNTTIYTIKLVANRTVSGNTYFATSDRTQITIYDLWPQVDSQWDVALVVMLLVIQWIFVFLAYRFYDEHIMVKYGFIAIALFLNGWLLALAHQLILINGVATNNFTGLFESSEILTISINWIFTAYIFIYLLYYVIHNVMQSTKKMGVGRKARG